MGWGPGVDLETQTGAILLLPLCQLRGDLLFCRRMDPGTWRRHLQRAGRRSQELLRYCVGCLDCLICRLLQLPKALETGEKLCDTDRSTVVS